MERDYRDEADSDAVADNCNFATVYSQLPLKRLHLQHRAEINQWLIK
jgi:hypothetical protein